MVAFLIFQSIFYFDKFGDICCGHVHKYEAVFGCFVDFWIVVTFWSFVFL